MGGSLRAAGVESLRADAAPRVQPVCRVRPNPAIMIIIINMLMPVN